MFSLSRPSEAQILAYLMRKQDLPFTYPDVGSSFSTPPAGYVVDHNRIKLGEGPAVYERGCQALKNWAMSRIGWLEILPVASPIEVGTTVALLARRFGVWSLFACRIVRVVEEHGPVEEFTFAYGTLPGHLLAGEERFSVRWERGDDSVWFDILALSRPASLLARLAYPVLRRVQRQFAPAALRAIARAVAGDR